MNVPVKTALPRTLQQALSAAAIAAIFFPRLSHYTMISYCCQVRNFDRSVVELEDGGMLPVVGHSEKVVVGWTISRALGTFARCFITRSS